jgi:hypothetical protein
MYLAGIEFTREHTVLLEMEVGHLLHLDAVKLHMYTHPCAACKIVDKNEFSFLALRYMYRR